MQNYIPQYNQQTNVTQQPVPQPVVTQPVTQPIQPQNVQVPYSGVNIQIFNPSVGTPGAAPVYNVNAPQYPTYPSGYYTQEWGNPNNNNNNNSNTTTTSTTTITNVDGKKNTEKRKIVKLTDEYIKNLENYLNSQDKDIRLMGAKEVVARLKEDDSRCDDKALTALINKMLQDPSDSVRYLALTALDMRTVTGDDYTVKLLQDMQNSKSAFGQDAVEASQILLKMSGQNVKKEFEVNSDDKCKKKVDDNG